MQPPILNGTILQNRYRIIKILGQGGMGRTYLAEDQGRFSELCAIKELIPVQTENYTLDKSKELFQREASILYQIQHPQVPQFRATFEQDQRLFLVQDHVEGKTYRTLLEERRDAGQNFSEAEVLRLLRQLLPVLAHLHSRGIIHRDISPENIILRENDARPVLIDFGVVKELATKLRSPRHVQPTTVGKFGYAPSEQLQTGRAYPNSDLYALAVTAVVLLTGKEPQELFDDNQLSWNWQDWVNISPGLAQVLNQMLSYKPSDRYQSVAQVVQALQALNYQPNPQLPTVNRQPTNPELSQIRTVAVGRRPDLIQPDNSKQNRLDPVIPAPKTREFWENPWAIAVGAIFVAIVAGIGSWAVVSAILRNQIPDSPQTFPSPLVSETPTPTPFETPTPRDEPVSYSQNINLPIGETAGLEGSLRANTTVNYTFNGEQGQQLSAILAQEGVLLSVLGPNLAPVEDSSQRVTQYQGILPFTGQYTVQLSPVQGVAEGNYKLDLRLDNPVEPTQPPETAPTPPDSTSTPSVVVPTADAEPINFDPGETEKQVSGQTSPQQPKTYLLNIQPGQQLSVAAVRGVVTLALRDPNGQRVPRACSYLVCKVRLIEGGEYQIQVIPNQEKESNFSLNVSVRN